MFATLAAALMTGVVGSLHCMGMCGGFAAAAASRTGWRGTAAYSAGRWTTYMILGAVAGAFGAVLKELQVVGIILAGAMLLYFAGRLMGWIPERGIRIPALDRLIARTGRAQGPASFAFGAVTSLIPCGLVYAALALPVVAGSPLAGAATMLAFGIGTTPALAAVGLGAGRLGTMTPGVRRALAVMVLVLGTYALVERFPTDGEPNCHDTGEEHAMGDEMSGEEMAADLDEMPADCPHHSQMQEGGNE